MFARLVSDIGSFKTRDSSQAAFGSSDTDSTAVGKVFPRPSILCSADLPVLGMWRSARRHHCGSTPAKGRRSSRKEVHTKLHLI
jgi:hypothetical protein